MSDQYNLLADIQPAPDPIAVLRLAVAMRDAQRAFFAARNNGQSTLRESEKRDLLKVAKRAEAAFDKAALRLVLT